MCFNRLDAPLRTDEMFRCKFDESFHKQNVSPLESLNMGLVSQVPLDYMYLVCLGVMKKLLNFWVHCKKRDSTGRRANRSHKLKNTGIQSI